VAEFKYDGMRAQLHLLACGAVRVFTRGCEDRTAAFPDVVAAVRRIAQAGCASPTRSHHPPGGWTPFAPHSL
jgi:ATP-dependent DNA ligase